MTVPAAPPLPPGCLTDPARPLTFTFEGRSIPALEGQSIGAALYAAGVRTFSRSFKYHRPRGLFCVSGDCPNCLMQVDGRPNVRTCIEPARQGQVVAGQNAWPSLNFDVLRVFDKLSSFLPVGFYYKRFHKPRWLWPMFERVVRHIAGLGRIDVNGRPDLETQVEHLHAEVCVVGGGPAGLAAAMAAAEAGADVLLLDRQPRLGGHLLYDGELSLENQALIVAVQRNAHVRVLCDTSVFGLYEGNVLGAFRAQRFLRVRAKQIVVCTGGRQQPALFNNNDLPGIFLARGVQRLGRLYGVRAGQRAAVLTDHDDGYRVAAEIARLGIEIVAVMDRRPPEFIKLPIGNSLAAWHSVTDVEALGSQHLQGLRVRRMLANPSGGFDARDEQIDCDLLCLATELAPANELLRQGPGLSATGAAAGAAPAMPAELMDRLPGKQFACLCEDVTQQDIGQAVAEGFDHIETLKRYSTVGMGPCQGKMCGVNFSATCARLTGRDLNAVGTTTARPPAIPVELAVLAADRRHHPVRRTPMHHWHQENGATWLDAGQWKRPEHYGDPAAEVRAVRNSVGLIDVSTLGKIEVIGPGAAELLERVYINAWADLAIGRARYGVMCTEEGIVFDDGVAARLPARSASKENHFYLTATTGNAEAVFQWLELWRTTWRLRATVLNRASAFAATNLAGPRSREVLGRLTPLDLSPAAFPYLTARGRGGRRPVPPVAHRLCRRVGLRDSLPRLPRPAPLGGAAGRRRGHRHQAVRRRGPAHPAAGKGPFHRGAGYRCPGQPAWRRAGPDGEVRQAAISRPGGPAAA